MSEASSEPPYFNANEDKTNARSIRASLSSHDRRMLADVMREIGATEGSLWWHQPEEQSLVIVANSGPAFEQLELSITQDLNSGLVSMVYHSCEGMIVHDVAEHPDHSKQVDRELGQTTQAMIVIPFFFCGAVRGVISAVILGEPGRFCLSDLGALQRVGAALQHSLETQLADA